MSFNGFNQNGGNTSGRTNLFNFGSQNSSNCPSPNSNPGFSNNQSPVAANSFGSPGTGSPTGFNLSPRPPAQKMSFNFTNRSSDSGKMVFKANGGPTTFRPPPLGNTFRPRQPERPSSDLKFNLTWQPNASVERPPTFPTNSGFPQAPKSTQANPAEAVSLVTSSDHIFTNQRRFDVAQKNIAGNGRSFSCLSDMAGTTGPQTKDTTATTMTPSAISDSSKPSVTPTGSSIFTKPLLGQTPEARKNLFDFSKPKSSTESSPTNSNPPSLFAPKPAAQPVSSTPPKTSTTTSLGAPVSSEGTKTSVVTFGSSSASPSAPPKEQSLFKSSFQAQSTSVPATKADTGAEPETKQPFKTNLFGSPQTTSTPFSTNTSFGSKTTSTPFSTNTSFGSKPSQPTSFGLEPTKPVSPPPPSIPSLFSLPKTKANLNPNPIEEEDAPTKIVKLTKNPFLTKSSFPNPISNQKVQSTTVFPVTNSFGANHSQTSPKSTDVSNGLFSKMATNSKDSTNNYKVSKSSTTTPSSGSNGSTSNLSHNGNHSNSKLDFASLKKPASMSLSDYMHRLSHLHESLVSQVKDSINKNPFKSLDEIVIQALEDKDKLVREHPEKETLFQAKLKGESHKPEFTGLRFFNPKSTEPKSKLTPSTSSPSSKTAGKFNFSFAGTSDSSHSTFPSPFKPADKATPATRPSPSSSSPIRTNNLVASSNQDSNNTLTGSTFGNQSSPQLSFPMPSGSPNSTPKTTVPFSSNNVISNLFGKVSPPTNSQINLNDPSKPETPFFSFATPTSESPNLSKSPSTTSNLPVFPGVSVPLFSRPAESAPDLKVISGSKDEPSGTKTIPNFGLPASVTTLPNPSLSFTPMNSTALDSSPKNSSGSGGLSVSSPHFDKNSGGFSGFGSLPGPSKSLFSFRAAATPVSNDSPSSVTLPQLPSDKSDSGSLPVTSDSSSKVDGPKTTSLFGTSKPFGQISSFSPATSSPASEKSSDSVQASSSASLPVFQFGSSDKSLFSKPSTSLGSTDTSTSPFKAPVGLGSTNVSTSPFKAPTNLGSTDSDTSLFKTPASFGLASTNNITAKPLFTFTSSSDATSTPKPDNQSESSDNSAVVSKPSPKFGSSSSSSPVPTFTFGSPAASSSASPKAVTKPVSPNTSTSPKPPFKFTLPETSGASPKAPFKFPLPDANSSTSKPSFTFGSPGTTSSSRIAFKPSTPDTTTPDSSQSNIKSASTTPPKPTFKFGLGPTVTDSKVPGNQSETSPLPKSTFSFSPNASLTSTPKPSFSLGQSSGSSPNTSFKFGPLNPTTSAATTEPDADNEADPADEGFSGARTNDELIVRGEGEEEESALITMTIKLLSYDVAKKTYSDMGVGVLKVNKHNTTQRQRIVCRAEGSGRLLLNANLPAASAEVIPKPRGIRLRINNLEGIPSLFIVRIRTDGEVDQLIAVLEEAKSGAT